MLTRPYQVALALNQSGISMLEKGCIVQAHYTISDALMALQCVLDSQDDSRDTYQMLERATHRLVHPELSHTLPFKTKPIYYDPSMPPYAAWLDSTIPESDFELTPIRIETSESDSYQHANPSTEVAILLVNVGITSFCLSQRKQDKVEPSVHLQNAYKFFGLSLQLSLRQDLQADPTMAASLLVVAFHAIRCILQVASLAPMLSHAEVEQYRALHQEIRMRIKSWEYRSPVMSLFSRSGKVAPAA